MRVTDTTKMKLSNNSKKMSSSISDFKLDYPLKSYVILYFIICSLMRSIVYYDHRFVIPPQSLIVRLIFLPKSQISARTPFSKQNKIQMATACAINNNS